MTDERGDTALRDWSAVADDWAELIDKVDRQLAPASDWMLRAAALRPGERVLDVAAGPGTMSLLAARAVGREGTVLCTDFAEPMVTAARARMAAAGLDQVRCAVMDGQALDLPDGSVDAALCRCGYMLMPDPAAALAETARVLAPGGRLALAVWAEPSANPWAALPMRLLLDRPGAPAPAPGAPGLWALADRQRLRELLQQAGFRDVELDAADTVTEYDSVAGWLTTVGRLAGPARALLEALDGSARAAVEGALRRAADGYTLPGGRLAVPGRLVVASARR